MRFRGRATSVSYTHLDVYKRQGGRSTLKLLRVTEHAELIEHARDLAGQLLSRDPMLESAPLLAQQLAEEEKQRNLDNLAKS